MPIRSCRRLRPMRTLGCSSASIEVTYKRVIDHRTEPIDVEVSVSKCAGASFVIGYRVHRRWRRVRDGHRRRWRSSTPSRVRPPGCLPNCAPAARLRLGPCAARRGMRLPGARLPGPQGRGAKGRHRRLRHALLSMHAHASPNRGRSFPRRRPQGRTPAHPLALSRVGDARRHVDRRGRRADVVGGRCVLRPRQPRHQAGRGQRLRRRAHHRRLCGIRTCDLRDDDPASRRAAGARSPGCRRGAHCWRCSSAT